MKKALLLIVGLVSIISTGVLAATPISPVVKVRTFDVVQGKYPQELWEGSASIISKGGLLVTNNHVAQNEDEENALGYIICFTMGQGTIPECNYTAHVIARDPDLDIALLQVDSTDINGKKVDFASLPVLEIDYSYIPKDSDKVQAIGYPGIGGDTLTTTNGTVAGTLKHNGFTYIKTDTTIAPGNSGGPMLSTAGKQIGLNTFGVSSSAESLGYGLLMSEAKVFIDEHKNNSPEMRTLDIDLGGYANKIDTINKQKKLTLPWLSYAIPAGYEVKNTTDDIVFSQTPKDQKDVQAAIVHMSIQKTPSLENEKTFLYYLESRNIYSKEYSKLVPTTIGGKKFFKVVSSWDDTAGEGGGLQLYVGQLNNNSLVMVIIYITGESEKKLAEVKSEKELILHNITFTDSSFVPAFDGNIVDPQISFTSPSDWVGDARGLDGVLHIIKYMNNIHDGISVSVNKTTKATSIQKLYTSELKDTPKNMKALGKFQGNDAFITCREGNGYGSSPVDENNKPLQQFNCNISTIIKSLFDVPYRIDIAIAGPRATKEAFMNSVFSMLTKEITVGNGKTTLPNLFKKSSSVIFTDLRDQTSAYRKKIETLIGYNLLLKNSTFGAYNPITYGLLAEKYLHIVHNISLSNSSCSTTICLLQKKTITVQGKNIPLYDLLSDVVIDWNSYVQEGKAEDFLFYIKLKLAGVTLPTYSEEIISQIKNDPENADYANIYNALDVYNAALYGSKKIRYEDVISDDYAGFYKSFFKSTKIISYIPNQGIVTTSQLSSKPLVFDQSIVKVECATSPLSVKCSPLKSTPGSFIILTKGAMVDLLVDEMDFGLFDPELAKKKEADISNESSLDLLDE